MKYKEKETHVAYGDTIYTVTESTPDIHKEYRKEIEEILYEVFIKYVPRKRAQKQEGVCKI